MRITEHLQAIIKVAGGLAGINSLYPTVWHYTLQNGRAFESVALTGEELAWTDRLLWRSHRPKQCYRNAQVSALTVPVPDGMALRYVEGYVMPADMPIPVEHAWLSVGGKGVGGKVIDTTLRDDGGQPIFGLIPKGWEYYGVPLDPGLCQHVLYHERHIPLVDDHSCHWPLLQG